MRTTRLMKAVACGQSGATYRALAGLLLALLISACANPRADQPPRATTAEVYFHCAKCESLVGGNYSSGRTQSFRSASASRCVHRWETVSESEFRRLAHDGFGLR